MAPPRVQIGDRVHTTQRVHRLPAGSIGRIQGIFDTGDLFDVLFVGYRVPSSYTTSNSPYCRRKAKKTNRPAHAFAFRRSIHPVLLSAYAES